MPTTETIWRVHYSRTFFLPRTCLLSASEHYPRRCAQVRAVVYLYLHPRATRDSCGRMPGESFANKCRYGVRIRRHYTNGMCTLLVSTYCAYCAPCTSHKTVATVCVCVCTKVSWAVIKIRKMENFPQCLCYKVHFTIRLLPANQPHSHIHLNVACCVITLF